MPTQTTWRENADFSRLLETLERPRILYIRRPIYVHQRTTNGATCLCGCLSDRAYAYQEVEHIDLLVDTIGGERLLRSDVADDGLAAFDREANAALRLECPIRCYDRQLDLILDDRHKVVAAFGGERGGKTSFGAEWLADGVFKFGGRGADVWWVAPTREKTQIGVSKLVRGHKADRWVAPIFPPEFVLWYPKDERQGKQKIVLVDGTTVSLKYAGKTGGNLKGDPALRIMVDEGCEVPHKSNWDTLLGRTMDSGGQLGFSSTPVLGSWAKEEIFDHGCTVAEARERESKGETVTFISEVLTCYENPWLNEHDVTETILAKAGTRNIEEAMRDPAVRREVLGEWVGEGDLLWRHFRDSPDDNGVCHLRSGPARDCGYWGLANVTGLALRSHFRGTQSKLDYYAGQDFNVYPNNTVILQIACPPELDQSDSKNWILVVLDEVVINGTIWELGKFLSEKAGRKRGLGADYYANMAIVGDGTAGQKNPPKEQGPFTKTASTPFLALKEMGFDVRPPMWHRATERNKSKRSPANPGRKDAVSMMHKLMRETVRAGDTVWPRLIVREDTCSKLIDVLQHQEGDINGLPIKESHAKSDRDCGIIEALWYAAWPVFSKEFYVKKAEIRW